MFTNLLQRTMNDQFNQARDLVYRNMETDCLVSPQVKSTGKREILRALEEAIDLVKKKQGEARIILVGGGSIIVGDHIGGVGEITRPKFYEVANAVGAAVYHSSPLERSNSFSYQ